MRAQSIRHRVVLLAAMVLTAVAGTLVNPAASASAAPNTSAVRVADTDARWAAAPLASVPGTAEAIQTTAAAAGWVHVDTYPSLLLCHIVAAAYHSGRPHRCEFWWFLWQLWVYK